MCRGPRVQAESESRSKAMQPYFYVSPTVKLWSAVNAVLLALVVAQRWECGTRRWEELQPAPLAYKKVKVKLRDGGEGGDVVDAGRGLASDEFYDYAESAEQQAGGVQVEAEAPPRGAAQGGAATPAPVEAKYFLTGVIPQQFASALQQGYLRYLRAAAAANRTAIELHGRFEEPALRADFPPARTEKYFPLSDYIDMGGYLGEIFGCIPRIAPGAWAEETESTVDLLVLFTADDETCTAERWRRIINSPPNYGPYQSSANHRGVTIKDKFLDTLKGRVKVQKAMCLPADTTAAEFVTATADYKTVLVTYDGVNLLGKGTGSCGFSPDDFPSYPPFASPWERVARAFAESRLGATPGASSHYGCVHMRLEKLFRFAVLESESENGVEFLPEKDGTLRSVELEACFQAVIELGVMLQRDSGGSLLLMHDMDPALGTASSHFDGWIEIADYNKWKSWANKVMNAKISGGVQYCGSPQHHADAGRDDVVGRILTENPRSCSVIEAAVCAAGERRMRLGDGSFGAFATHIDSMGEPLEGPEEFSYERCPDVIAAARACKKSGKCKAIKLRA